MYLVLGHAKLNSFNYNNVGFLHYADLVLLRFSSPGEVTVSVM